MWPYPQETAGLVTFTGEILNGKLHFCAVIGVSEPIKRLAAQSTAYTLCNHQGKQVFVKENKKQKYLCKI